jgi:hypothetical protein
VTIRARRTARPEPPRTGTACGARPSGSSPDASLAPARLSIVPDRDPRHSARIERARARIAARFYDRADVREKLLDALMDELVPR